MVARVRSGHGRRRPRHRPEHQAAIDAGRPWLPGHQPRAETEPETTPETKPLRTEPAAGHDNPAAPITDAIGDMKEATQRFAEEQASRQARSEYAARISRQAEAQPEAHATPAAEAPSAEIEL